MDKGLAEFTLATAETSDRLLIGQARIHPESFKKMIRTVDTALFNIKPSQSSQLVWTKCAALIGYNSQEPTASTNHLWEKAAEAFQHHTKSTNIFVGCLVRWRITVRAHARGENWITAKEESNKIDVDTGNPITQATYWINNDFDFSKYKKKSKKVSAVAATKSDFNQLAAKFNRKR